MSRGTGFDSVPQHDIGRSHTGSCQNASLETGRRMHSSHSVKVYFAHRGPLIIAHEHPAGARACLGRRYEVLRLFERVVLINFFQVFRN
jgi:hypothetical protein